MEGRIKRCWLSNRTGQVIVLISAQIILELKDTGSASTNTVTGTAGRAELCPEWYLKALSVAVLSVISDDTVLLFSATPRVPMSAVGIQSSIINDISLCGKAEFGSEQISVASMADSSRLHFLPVLDRKRYLIGNC